MPNFKNQVTIRREDIPEDSSPPDIARIRQSFEFTTAHHTFNIHEYRIMIRIIQALQPQMIKNVNLDLLEEIEISIPTIKLVSKGTKNYSYMKNALDSLRKKSIEVKGEDSKGKYIKYTGLIKSSKAYESNRLVSIQIDKDVLPIYLEMKGGFTQFSPEITFGLSSVNTMRLHQFCSHWRDKGYQYLPVKSIVDLLGLKESIRASFIKRDILKPACEELKLAGDTYFTFKEKTNDSKKIIGFEVFIHDKRKDVKLAEPVKKLWKDHFDLTPAQFKQIDYLFNDPQSVVRLQQLAFTVSELIQAKSVTDSPVKSKSLYALESIRRHFSEKNEEDKSLSGLDPEQTGIEYRK